MGDISDQMVNGESCCICGMPFLDEDDNGDLIQEEYGYPVVCGHCWESLPKEQRSQHQCEPDYIPMTWKDKVREWFDIHVGWIIEDIKYVVSPSYRANVDRLMEEFEQEQRERMMDMKIPIDKPKAGG